MPAAAKEEMLASPNAEGSFSLAAGVAAALDTRDGANADRGEKSHQGIFSKNRRPRIGSTWLKWSGTHQDRSLAWSETMLGPTIYLYSGLSLVEELDGSGNILARYTQGRTIDEPLAELRSGTTSYYEQDGVNSVSSLSNAAGALANTYSYDSFGKATSTGTLTNPFQYTGREFDSETGIYYYRARYFDPSAGRFLSEDPARLRGGVNFYAYTRNRPVLLTDPSGYQGGCPPQSSNCVPTDPDAPYQGSDGLWYNTLDWNGQTDPTPSLPGPTPPPSPEKPGPTCDCSSNSEYWSRYFRILDEANDKRLTALWWTLGISGGNGISEKGFEHWGAEAVGEVVAPIVEALDLGHFTYENLKIDTEVGVEVEALKREMGCK
jgi:RHS repeat-associated protein